MTTYSHACSALLLQRFSPALCPSYTGGLQVPTAIRVLTEPESGVHGQQSQVAVQHDRLCAACWPAQLWCTLASQHVSAGPQRAALGMQPHLPMQHGPQSLHGNLTHQAHAQAASMQPVVLVATTSFPPSQLPPSVTQLFGRFAPTAPSPGPSTLPRGSHRGGFVVIPSTPIGHPRQAVQQPHLQPPTNLLLGLAGSGLGQGPEEPCFVDALVDDVISRRDDVVSQQTGPGATGTATSAQLQPQAAQAWRDGANEADVQAGTALLHLVSTIRDL